MSTTLPAPTGVGATLFEHTVIGNGAVSLLVGPGRSIRLTAMAPDACASTLVLSAGPTPQDRLNLPDTLKAQHSARVTPPMVLMSDLGVGLASVTGSSLDWHDVLGAHSTDLDLAEFVPTSYAQQRNARHLSARHGFLSELRKHGRSELDLHACVNFFAKLATSSDDRGSLTWVPGHSAAGDWVELRSEVPLLIIVAASQHPLDPREAWEPADIGVTVAVAEPWGDDDPSWTHRDESRRALEASRRYVA